MATAYDGEDVDNGEPKIPQWYILKCQVNRENRVKKELDRRIKAYGCLLYTSPSPRDS